MKIVALLKNKTMKNTGWLIGGKIIQMLLSLFVGVLTSRYLGPSNLGLVNYGLTYTTFFASLCSLGINSVLVKEIIDNPDKEGTVIGTSLVLRAISSFLSMFAIFGICFLVDNDEPLTIFVVFLCSLGVIFQISETFNYWFQSKLKSKFTAIAILIGYIATSVYRVVLMITEQPVQYFALATSIDYLVVGIFLIVSYFANGGRRLSFSWSYAKALLGRSWHFIIPGLMVAVYSQTDKFMLKQMISEAEIGYYSTALTVCNMWCFVLAAIIDSFYPSIMELHKNNNIEQCKKRNKQLYAIVFYTAVVVSSIICLFAPLIIQILYGEAYAPSVNPLRIITWYTAFSYLGVARNAWIVSNNRQKYLTWIYLGSAVANVALNIVLIPLLGSSGAALASLGAQIFTIFVMPLFIKPLRENTKMMAEAIIFKGVK